MKRWLHEFAKGQYGAAIKLALGVFFGTSILMLLALVDPRLAPTLLGIALVSLLALVVLALLISSRIIGRLDDVSASISLNAALARLDWRPEEFFTDGAAATPSLQLLLLKCLQLCKPVRVLELGSGQTSKLLALYIRDSPAAEVLTIEEDEGYGKLLAPYLLSQAPHYEYRHSRVVPVEFLTTGRVRVHTRWYQEAGSLIRGTYNLVIVDGPSDADSRFARSGILTCMPQALADSFVVIFDDADRYGAATTIRLFQTLLRNSGRPFTYFEVHGIKTHAVFCSSNYRFLRST